MTHSAEEVLTDFIPGVDLRIRRGAANVILESMDRHHAQPGWTTVAFYPWVQFYPDRVNLLAAARKQLLDAARSHEVI